MTDQQQRQAQARVEYPTNDARRYERFLRTVQVETGLDRDHAERAVMATMCTLAERVSAARAQELGEDLPEALRSWLRDAGDQPEAFGVEEFVRRVAEREELGVETAEGHTRAVFHALARVAPAYEIDDLVDELPDEYERLLGDVAREIGERGEPEVRSYDRFVELVKRRADLDRVEAQRASELVLETLAERLTGSEVEDLQRALPPQFREPLERGRTHVHGAPRALSLDDFVERVAGKEEVSFEEAFEHTRAVFATLVEALPYREVRDILHELPRGYRETLL